MKIIHTADIHLDSQFCRVANPSQRRLELLRALSNMGEYANNNGVSAVIVAGDLFDDKFTTEKTIFSVADIINNCQAKWFVLMGNHGDKTPYNKLKGICNNLCFFENNWTTYQLDDVVICGRELGQNDQELWQTLSLEASNYNVLVLHGDVDSPEYGFIDKKAIQTANVNYVALGHRHSFATHKFGKTIACYSGVLEARGFDEKAPTGFVLLDTSANSIKFVKQAIRCVETITVDVTGIQSEIALENLVAQKVSQVNAQNYVNVVLVGELGQHVEVNAVSNYLQGRYFALRVDNQTRLSFDIEKLSQEISLKGEFVRQALALPDSPQKEQILKMGLTLLEGGDLQ